VLVAARRAFGTSAVHAGRAEHTAWLFLLIDPSCMGRSEFCHVGSVVVTQLPISQYPLVAPPSIVV
jgi:hypothetical protein